MQSFSGAALIPMGQIHYIDHLAAISVIFDIPLIVLEEECENLARKYYPHLNILKLDEYDITPEFLISNYDVLFTSDVWNQEAFDKQFRELEIQYKKKMRRVFCPHGFSDKGFYFKSCKQEDICLVYGNNMLDMLKRFAILETIKGILISGNYRYTYYKKESAFFENIVQTEVLNKFEKQQPIILYAPTWQDYENSTTFFDYFNEILEKLPETFNMIVKLHPMLELNDPANYYLILGKYEKKPNILFLREFPLVYPLLKHADLYIGDMSSIGYDFLTFNKPMFFLNKLKREADSIPLLFQCGTELRPADFPNLYPLVEKQFHEGQKELSKKRQETYLYTFGEERPFAAIKNELLSLLDRAPS